MKKQPEVQPKRFHFSVERLEKLPIPSDKPAVYFDDDVKQLAVRIQPTGTRTFVTIKRSRGVTFRKTLGGFPELQIEAARKHARRLLNENSDWKAGGYKGVAPLAKPVDEKAITFGMAFESHVQKARAKMERKGKDPNKTEQNLRNVYDVHLSQFQNTPLDNLTATRMVDLHAKIAERGKYAANRVIELIRAVFNHAIKKGLATADPTRAVEMFPEQRRTRYLQPEELVRLEKILAEESNRDVADFIRLLLSTGARKGSLYTSRWEQINFPLSTWTIPETKNGQPLTVELTPDALAVFQAREHKRVNDGPWVFPSKESASGHVVDYKAQWSRIRKAAGIPDVRAHSLRHTFASYQIISGASLPLVGGSLGHRSSRSTEVYSHLHQSAVRDGVLAGEQKRKQMTADAAKKLKADERRKARKLQIVPVAS